MIKLFFLLLKLLINKLKNINKIKKIHKINLIKKK